MKKFFINTFLVFLFSLLQAVPVLAEAVNTPSIIDASEKKEDGRRILEVKGLAPADADVLVYINLQVAGVAKVRNENDEISSFFYSQENNLPAGSYDVSVVARDKNSYVVSDFSKTVKVSEDIIIIEEKPVPKVFPPTLLRSVIDSDSSYNRPKIIGQGIAGQRIEVFIDEKKDGQLLLNERNSGSVQFIYIPAETLKAGQHKAYLYSYDKDNNQSEKSNIIFINVSGEGPGRIDVGQSEGIKTEESQKGAVENDMEDTGLSEILGIEPSTTTEAETGMIDSDKEKQSQLRLNIVVFLLFLAAIIIWIFWVNRELIKEKEKEAPRPENLPVGDIDKSSINDKKNEIEYGVEKDRNDIDVLKF